MASDDLPAMPAKELLFLLDISPIRLGAPERYSPRPPIRFWNYRHADANTNIETGKLVAKQSPKKNDLVSREEVALIKSFSGHRSAKYLHGFWHGSGEVFWTALGNTLGRDSSSEHFTFNEKNGRKFYLAFV